MKPNVALGRALGILQRFSQVSLSSKLFALASHPPYSKDSQSPLWWFSLTRFDYNGAEKSHDLLTLIGMTLKVTLKHEEGYFYLLYNYTLSAFYSNSMCLPSWRNG